MKIEVSNGEILDKMTILQIKKEKIGDTDKLNNIQKEIEELSPFYERFIKDETISSLYNDLYQVNLKLWLIEDNIRELEYNLDFGDDFVKLARLVYKTNDERAQIKKQINIISNSEIVEEKSYKNYIRNEN
jgi:hypothetical protein